MFDEYTFETLLQEMLDETGAEFDVSEISPIYAAYSTAAAQVAKLYRNLNRVVELGFASTSEDEYLEKRTSEMGVFFNPAVPALRKGLFNIPVPLGSRFFVQNLYFEVVSNEGIVQLQCETPGVIGNSIPAGTEMLPLDNFEGLEFATLGEIIIPGSEKESDGSLFVKYQEKVADPATSGNKAHYKEWTREIEGVGAVKVFANWDGPDTVKVVIVNTEYKPASIELVQIVQEDLDPVPGQGEGRAPVGAFVTAVSATPRDLNVSAFIEVDSSITAQEAEERFKELLAAYLKTIAFREDVEPIIRQRMVGSLLVSIPGVIDYSNLLLNMLPDNIILGEEETPIVGQVTFNV